jgi:hypothetical protein
VQLIFHMLFIVVGNPCNFYGGLIMKYLSFGWCNVRIQSLL